MWKNIVDQDTLQITILRIRIECWITKATKHNQNMLYLLLFHCNNCYTNTLQCYVICTFRILFDLVALSKYTSCPKSSIPILKVHHMIGKAARNRQSSENCSLTQICFCI